MESDGTSLLDKRSSSPQVSSGRPNQGRTDSSSSTVGSTSPTHSTSSATVNDIDVFQRHSGGHSWSSLPGNLATFGKVSCCSHSGTTTYYSKFLSSIQVVGLK